MLSGFGGTLTRRQNRTRDTQAVLNSDDEGKGQPSRSQTFAPAGVDKYFPKSGAWTTRGDGHNVVDVRYSVSPVV